ncbi:MULTISPECIES: hypothetical protein [Gordonia]|uniref:hypothetical protein n=1 Tax=Gordonia TaxID=2053 RepID=UPI0001DDAA63|nr:MULTISPECIES: hypothetical protein [Gordonia]ADK68896.1 hypothetical protein KTR9_4815 [Gordonia sp. KTR9]MCZ4581558.1 hypothetical protein [Gordonia amicalis]
MTTPTFEQVATEFIASQAGISVDEAMPQARELVTAVRDSGLTVLALPTGVGPDGDGQVWFDDFDIRVDMTGKRDDTRLYVNGEPRTPDAVFEHAVALIAAAQRAQGETS